MWKKNKNYFDYFTHVTDTLLQKYEVQGICIFFLIMIILYLEHSAALKDMILYYNIFISNLSSMTLHASGDSVTKGGNK